MFGSFCILVPYGILLIYLSALYQSYSQGRKSTIFTTFG